TDARPPAPQSPPARPGARDDAPAVLVFGGSGQIGRPVLARLTAAGRPVLAVSRAAQPAVPGVRWLRGDLSGATALPPAVDAILGCGPLDALAAWFDLGQVDCRRLVAFGSTSVEVKRDSGDAGERDVAARLRAAEARLFE